MTWTRITGFVAGFLAILAYMQFFSMRIAVLIFLLFASCLVFLVYIWPNLRPKK